MIRIISDIRSPRLDYVLDFVFNHVLNTGYKLTLENQEDAALPAIFYGKTTCLPLSFSVSQIVEEQGVLQQKSMEVLLNAYQEYRLGHRAWWQLDVFGMIFYCLSRYEEYLIKGNDHWGRFTARQSHLVQMAKNHPVVDELIFLMKEAIVKQYPSYKIPEQKNYTFQATMDIDQAWAYKYRGMRNILSVGKAIQTLDFKRLHSMWKVLIDKQDDPFYTYEYIKHQCQMNGKKMKVFMLLAGKLTSIDRNHHPSTPEFRALVQELARFFDLGIHPSFRSTQNICFLKEEISELEQLAGKSVHRSRQHFLLLRLPQTYRQLIQHGIDEDYTMGFADEVGYRAGTGHSFYWYDLEEEQVTPLKIFPFQIMDATLKNYMNLNSDEAIQLITAMKQQSELYHSPVTFIWHNSSLDESGEWKGWRQVFEYLMRS